MARIRYLKPEFFTDEDLSELPFEARLLYAGLWCHADKAGRQEDRPKYLKAMIFPYDKIDIDKLLSLLCQKPFINRYETDGKRFIEIPSWDRHQKPHHTEKESQIPPAPPLTEKGMEKGMENQLNPSTELRNGCLTVKKRISNKFNYSEEFLSFYSFYPKKADKDDAWVAWQKRNGNRPPLENLLNAISKQTEWRKSAKQGEFRPEWKNPATWISKGSWADEVPEEKKTVW